jgi:hypothetical protein
VPQQVKLSEQKNEEEIDCPQKIKAKTFDFSKK